MKSKIEKMFGKYICDDETLKKFMPRKDFNNYKKIKLVGEPLDKKTAKSIAKAIKTWALKMKATHYTHWFMPLNNKTAEKQVSFIEKMPDGKLMIDFSEKSLIKGETDASSFPNGGERLTFEARGYTVWDYSSPVFIKKDSANNKVVYIPTAFCSYNGTALDEKTPLLRAVESLNTQSLRFLKLLNHDEVKKVDFFVGAEQEYFLIKTEDYEKRLDLKLTGRTLLGSKTLKSQEECSHYFGMIEDKISLFMNEVDTKLWKMGITAKLQHNEVAPSQYEIVPIFNQVNTASDQNQIIMETLSSTAKKYGLTALFHEKPFSGINGSGKHCNWSLSTDTGLNLFSTELKDPILFYSFFVAMVCAIDKYYPIIRLSTAYRSNDLRLGGDEAPPALISLFASDYILEKLNSIEQNNLSNNEKPLLNTGVKSLPKTEKDFCDRNRTSPFAFTGNKFEFRMPGASQSVAWPSTCICSCLASVIKEFCDKIELSTLENKYMALLEELKSQYKKHKKIIFNGNGYDPSWKEEAKKRGLKEYRTAIEAFSVFEDENLMKAFTDSNVFTPSELNLRKSTMIKNYIESVMLEAKTLIEIVNKNVLNKLHNLKVNLLQDDNTYSKRLNKLLSENIKEINNLTSDLLILVKDIEETLTPHEKLEKIKNKLFLTLNKIRNVYDDTEKLLPQEYEPLPSYNTMLL